MAQSKKTLITHNGRFHADDIFACAALQILLDAQGEAYEIIRTRDLDVIATGDFVFDVGGEYDSETNRFDHHQQGRAGARENGIFYSSLGLIWKSYGEAISGSKEVAAIVEKNLVETIDAGDNGMETFTAISNRPLPYLIQNAFSAFMPTWKEEPKLATESFMKLSGWAKEILEREIVKAKDLLEAENAVEEIYKNASDKRVLILPERYPWEELLLKYPEPLLVIVQPSSGGWKVEGVFKNQGSFERRMYLPEAWAGKLNEEMASASGVPDAIFCHNGRQLAVTHSKEGALKLAELALQA